MPNISKEDYLSIIFKNKDERNEVKPNLIAEKLEVSNAAVTDMLKKLSREGLITHEKYKSVSLTREGETYARNMVRRHRIWEVFLHQIIGMPWEKVHEEANNLEHSSSDELIDRMEEMLQFPEYDPHGDPIPSKEGKMPGIRRNVPLSILKSGDKGRVIRVSDFDENFLNYISGIGIRLNEMICVEQILSFDKSMRIQVSGSSFNISEKLASNIFMEIL